MGFKKGWRAYKASKRKRTRKSPPKRRRTVTRRRNPSKRRTMRKKNFNVNLLDLGGGIVLADQFLGKQAFDQVLALKVPDLKGLPAHLRQRSTQEQLIKTGMGIAVLKTLAKGFARQVGAIGPLKLKIG
jgi:hypothetical protein